MKNKIILILFGVLALAIAQAQTPFKQELYIGASFGTNFSSISFAPKVKTKQLMGFTGGIMARWNTENHIGLQAEINYSQNGWDEDFEDFPDKDYQYTRTLNYLELPFLTHIYFGGKRARFFINLGPKISYLLSESTSQRIDEAAIEGLVTKQHNLPVKYNFSWGLCGGPGFELRTGVGTFSLEGRYYYGLGDIFSNSKGDVDYFAKSSPQVLSVKLAYLFPIF